MKYRYLKNTEVQNQSICVISVFLSRFFCLSNPKVIFSHLRRLITGVAARETAQALRTLAQAARGVAASTKEPQAAAAMLDSAQYVMEGSAMLIHEAHQALVHPGDAESQQRLAQVGRLRPPL